MIDFSDCKRLVNNYDGADMKLRIEYNNQIYMLKFGQKLESNEKKPLQASYSSAPISEWLGCNVFSIAGKAFRLPVQETLLGTFNNKLVVACKDFIANRPDSGNLSLLEFKKLENSYLDSWRKNTSLRQPDGDIPEPSFPFPGSRTGDGTLLANICHRRPHRQF